MNPLWIAQVKALLRLEVRKSLLTPRAFPVYLLAALPVLIVVLLVVVHALFGFDPGGPDLESPQGIAVVFAYVFQFLLRFALYAGCVWIFMGLFRGEILDRSLHYYFLAPVRREVLVAGKFLAGWIAATALFVTSGIVAQVLLHSAAGAAGITDVLLSGSGIARIVQYGAITALACLGYGAVFLVIGLLMRNPTVPAFLIWIWEWSNPFLPALLKKISVIFYMQSLLPVPIVAGPLGIVAAPTPAYLAVPGLFLFTGALLWLAGRRIRGMEIAYGAD